MTILMSDKIDFNTKILQRINMTERERGRGGKGKGGEGRGEERTHIRNE